MLEEFLSSTYAGNTGQEYLYAFLILIGIFAVLSLFDYFVVRSLRKREKKGVVTWKSIIADFVVGVNWLFYVYLSLYLASLYLAVPQIVGEWRDYILIIFIGFFVGRGFSKVIDGFVDKQIEKRKKKHKLDGSSMMKVLGTLAKVVVWIIILLTILSNFGVEITALVAGLGIGGIAIALALQKVLGDLFSAFVIYFDKPFKEGDFIIVGDDLGLVKKIGIKSTRIQALGGQELIMSNTELTNARINNYKQMQRRRVAFEIGVQYNTGSKKLRKAKKEIQNIINKMEGPELDRVHFKKYGDSALIFEIVYYIDTADYNKYMDIQEEMNLKIYEAFEKLGIGFAFPTRTLHFENSFGGLGGKSSGKGSKSSGKSKK